jgi:ssDNA-specific exonuclease RecJ
VNGEKRSELVDTYLSAFVKRDSFRDIYAGLYHYESAEITEVIGSICKKEGCERFTGNGMMFCAHHRRK